jgi:acetyl esterase/lipase
VVCDRVEHQVIVYGMLDDLASLPPAWVGVGERDLLNPENIAYAERLKAFGAPCEIVAVPAMHHGADGAALKANSMQEFRRSMVNHL